jgi:hypothetical protein
VPCRQAESICGCHDRHGIATVGRLGRPHRLNCRPVRQVATIATVAVSAAAVRSIFQVNLVLWSLVLILFAVVLSFQSSLVALPLPRRAAAERQRCGVGRARVRARVGRGGGATFRARVPIVPRCKHPAAGTPLCVRVARSAVARSPLARTPSLRPRRSDRFSFGPLSRPVSASASGIPRAGEILGSALHVSG